MDEHSTRRHEANSYIQSLVETALAQDNLSGLAEMLKSISEAVDAYGCILWDVAPGLDLNAMPPSGRLFVLSQWFQDTEICTLHNLPINRSLTGEAILKQTSLISSNIWNDEKIFKEDRFLERASIKTMCSVPIHFIDGSGAINLYRNSSRVFSENEIAQVEQLASLVAKLYQTIQDKVSFNLIKAVNEILHKAEIDAVNSPLNKEKIKEVFQRICNSVADIFQCIEVSIFLEDALEAEGKYNLMATTWPEQFQIKQSTYRQSREDGLTGWTAALAQSVRIRDLAHFDSDKEYISLEYPGITWKDSLDIKSAMRRILALGNDDELPPLSFISAPILTGEKVLGVIRCCTAKKGSYSFSNRELSLLNLVAAQLGQYWSNWLSRNEMMQENDSWRALVQSVNSLNQFVYNEFTTGTPDELYIFDEAMRVTSTVIGGAEILDVRLLNEQKQELYFAKIFGNAWNEGDKNDIQKRLQRRFPVQGKPQSAGAYVYQTGKVHIVRDIRNDPYYSETFPDIKRVIVAPISVGKDKLGVLDIRGTGESDFPKHAEDIAELLGNQLGLYHYLANNIKALHSLRKQQSQTFEDLEHQFKSPIIQAYARIKSVLKDISFNDELREKVKAILGLCGKAKRVAMSAGLFAKLARGEEIRPKLKRLHYEYLIRMLIEVARDNELMIDSKHNIIFNVARRSPEALKGIRVEADYNLLEQAVNCLMDNAGKYSFPEEQIEIYWGVIEKEHFFISVINRGLPIRPDEVQQCKERGWRSPLVEHVAGEGSGIGLWIVDNIMKAHAGALEIIPTTEFGLTEVRLLFPCSKI